MPIAPETLLCLSQCLARQPKVATAWLFGSRAQNRARADSDFDIGLLCIEPLTLNENLQLQWELMPILESDRIDLVMLREVSPVLSFEAICGLELVCKDLPQKAQFCSLTSRLYEDTMARIASQLKQRGAASGRGET